MSLPPVNYHHYTLISEKVVITVNKYSAFGKEAMGEAKNESSGKASSGLL